MKHISQGMNTLSRRCMVRLAWGNMWQGKIIFSPRLQCYQRNHLHFTFKSAYLMA